MADTKFIARQLTMTGLRFYEVSGVIVFPVLASEGCLSAVSIAYLLGDDFEKAPCAVDGSLGRHGKKGEGKASCFALEFSAAKEYTGEMIHKMVAAAAAQLEA